jgi:hypothetical protein
MLAAVEADVDGEARAVGRRLLERAATALRPVGAAEATPEAGVEARSPPARAGANGVAVASEGSRVWGWAPDSPAALQSAHEASVYEVEERSPGSGVGQSSESVASASVAEEPRGNGKCSEGEAPSGEDGAAKARGNQKEARNDRRVPSAQQHADYSKPLRNTPVARVHKAW